MRIFQLLHISLYNIKKKKTWSLLLPLRSSEKSLRIRKLWSLQCQRQVFQNSDFHLKAQILFTTEQKYSQLFPLRWPVLCLFSRKHPSLNNQSACKPFFLEKMAFPEKSSYFNSQLHCTSTYPRDTGCFERKHKGFMHTSHFVTQNIKKAWTAGLDCNKLTIFTASSRTFLSKTGLSSSSFGCDSKQHNDTGSAWGSGLPVL